jgi:hypothetical protein
MTRLIPDAPIGGPASWVGSDLQDRDEWIHQLSSAEIAELEAAMAQACSSGKPLVAITRDDFPLDVLAATLERIADELENGRGFVLIRGLPVERYSEEQATMIFWGIGRHLGIPVSQNGAGDLLGHVRDVGAKPGGPSIGKNAGRGYNSNAGLDYHSDGSDVVALFCLHPARSGGVSTIASAVRVHDQLLRSRPDLLPLLYEPLPHTQLDEIDADQPGYLMSCLYTYDGATFSALSSIKTVLYTYRTKPDIGPMDPRLMEVEQLQQDWAAEYHLDMDFQAGDIQLLNNYAIMHSRTEFTDWPEPERRRHLLRLWLTLYNGRPLPPDFGHSPGYADSNGGRGGKWRRKPGT